MSQGKVVPSEHQIQSAFFDWVRWNRGRYPSLNLCFAVPNAAKRGPGLAAWLRAEGLEAGIPDCLLIISRHGFTGLALEFKRPGRGQLSARQVEKIRMMRDEGWLVYVVTDAEEAINAVKRYLIANRKIWKHIL